MWPGEGPGLPGELAAAQDRYDGARVETSGRVRAIEDGGDGDVHYILEDEAHNRVAVERHAVRGFVGEVVTVEGLFTFDERHGRMFRKLTVVAPSSRPRT